MTKSFLTFWFFYLVNKEIFSMKNQNNFPNLSFHVHYLDFRKVWYRYVFLLPHHPLPPILDSNGNYSSDSHLVKTAQDCIGLMGLHKLIRVISFDVKKWKKEKNQIIYNFQLFI